MTLSARLAEEFNPAVRNKGRQYYWQGRVRIQDGSEFDVEARVRGTRSYGVSLDWEDGLLSAWCDCAYFDSDGACKHLWATILAAEARGHLSAAANDPTLVLDCGTDPVGEQPLDVTAGQPFALEPPARTPAWLKQLTEIAGQARSSGVAVLPAKRLIHYLVDVQSSVAAGNLIISLQTRERKADGSWGKSNALSLKRGQIAKLPLSEDREILSTLAGSRQHNSFSYLDYDTVPASCLVMHPLAGIVMPMAIRTGRCYLREFHKPDDLNPLAWDDGDPWRFRLQMSRHIRGGWALAGVLCRGEERMDLSTPVLITPGGLVFTKDRVARLAEGAAFDWILNLRRLGHIQAPDADRDQLIGTLLSGPGMPELMLPEELRFQEVHAKPQPRLKILGTRPHEGPTARLRAELSFIYEDRNVPAADPAAGLYDSENRRFVRRDREQEQAAVAQLEELGLKLQTTSYSREAVWELASKKLPRVVRELVGSGWRVEADGKMFRRSGEFKLEVSSGIDWFELHGEVQYEDTKAQLPALLEALRRGENMVRLDDGSYGVLPEEWLGRIGMLAGLGTPDSNHLRFRRTQAGLLDALLATQPEARCDEQFGRVREELRQFQGIYAADQPTGFVGQLRDYQREGLGWMHFLRRFSFGGCLADDMGVGKTAQVLALLETRRELRAGGEAVGPSLVVVPRSLVFNWKQEAERFTPKLRVLDYTGLARSGNSFEGYDIVLSTYGTMRRDILSLKDVEFDYIVLDEAQAIKNAGTESSKAARLLRAGNRLALSGTPVENHLGELWSLFEFLNPGMLGAASVFKLSGPAARNPDEDTRRLLAHALRPFILRRTKDQVARELPARTEQTMYCEMEPPQRKLYNELREHYRGALLQRIDRDGLGKAKILVLEALLRLRQAACHPGLIDVKRAGEPSAKLDVLMEQLREVVDERHKALVFSQFTSLLKIVRERLDSKGIVYEYLDGATRDRQARVERFQNDPECRLFLISLKAGGLGLNLTAAEYVFLLDPWWNPAVEAQAVDRAHRIGQTKQVFAYRLIARDTVEEKVLELQKSKRDLAASIINQDNSVIRNLSREDLEVLLS